MEAAADEFRLEDVAHQHRIAASLFVPFAIVRLRSNPEATEAMLTINLRNVGDGVPVQRRLHLSWSAGSAPMQPLGVQEGTLTEWAALGVACVIVPQYLGLRIEDVATEGDRFDYWLTDGTRDYGLEVSGTMTEDVEARHREKVRQLRANPHGVDGFVIAVGFSTRTAIISFNRFEGEAS
jgi:hypothetical protein